MTHPSPVVLDGELTITGAAGHHATLLAALAQPDEALVLDLSEVEACDSAGIQLLLATRRSLAAQGRALRLAGLSDSVVQALRTYGLEAMFRSQAGADA